MNSELNSDHLLSVISNFEIPVMFYLDPTELIRSLSLLLDSWVYFTTVWRQLTSNMEFDHNNSVECSNTQTFYCQTF